MSEHQPQRPTWQCAACDRPWPCDPGRRWLARRYDDMLLPVHMSLQLELAAEELQGVSPEELFDRFIAWTHRTPLPAGGPAIGRARVPRAGQHRAG